MTYEFKNLNAVDMIEETNDTTTVLGVHEGNIVQMPAGNMGGGAGLLFEITEEDLVGTSGPMAIAKNYDPIYETLLKGGSVVFKIAPEVLGLSIGVPIFCTPVSGEIQPGTGFVSFLMIPGSDGIEFTPVVFTNGSYHN